MDNNCFTEHYKKKSAELYEKARLALEGGEEYQHFIDDAVLLDNRIKEIQNN